jgi:hypothetical protein
MAPSIGLLFGSRQRMACRFVPNGPYPPQAYVGIMNTIGLDVGITAGGVMAWGVLPGLKWIGEGGGFLGYPCRAADHKRKLTADLLRITKKLSEPQLKIGGASGEQVRP